MTPKEILAAMLKQDLAVAVETDIGWGDSEWSVYLFDQDNNDHKVDYWDSETISEVFWATRKVSK